MWYIKSLHIEAYLVPSCIMRMQQPSLRLVSVCLRILRWAELALNVGVLKMHSARLLETPQASIKLPKLGQIV